MREHLVIRAAISGIAVALVTIHLLLPNLKLDAVAVALIALCALPWLQPLIKSVELPGMKIELQEMKSDIAEAKGASQSALKLAGLAVPTSLRTVLPSSTDQETSGAATSDAVVRLALEYERIRNEQKRGDARTRAMTGVVRQMIEAAQSLGSFDLTQALVAPSPGLRLFAYAYLFAKPDVRYAEQLSETVTTVEDQPFGQYWGLLALGRVLAETSSPPRHIKVQLRAMRDRLKPGTDRYYELGKILQRL